MSRVRCFGDGDPIMARYHDEEWGVPVDDGRELFEHLALDIFQAGLSWRVILRKREGFRKAFSGFEPPAIAQFDDSKVAQLMNDTSIVRDRRKIKATIGNSKAWLAIESEEGFSKYLWSFVRGRTIKGPMARSIEELPTQSPESETMAKGLKERGFRFVGPTICYAFMQAVGMVDDHLIGCFKYSGRP